jgi:DNA-binding CsgD family transcriptional regulator
MPTLSSHLPYRTDQFFNEVLKQRSRPYVVVLDDQLDLAFADPQALALLETHFQSDHASTLSTQVRDAVNELVQRWRQNESDSEVLAFSCNGVFFRVVPLMSPEGPFYAVFCEKEARREDLRQAVARFSFTPREVEVLDLILNGMNAAEIAETLHIAEVTVFDHFKHISHKTRARNRADMLAKVFNWQAVLRAGPPGVKSADCRGTGNRAS